MPLCVLYHCEIDVNDFLVGIYVASRDFEVLRGILVADEQYKDQYKLLDPVISMKLYQKLLDSGIQFTLLIVPTRNTNFSHLRDGFIRSVTGNPKVKQLQEYDDITLGLGQLRMAFSR